MNTPYTFIFIGRSGCGKGTQAKLLEKYLAEHAPESTVFYLETGKRFREFITGGTATAHMSKKIMDEAGRQPDFLAVWMWSHVLVEELSTEEKLAQHWLVDGTPRSLTEALAFDSAIRFYERGKAFIVHLDVSREWSEEHLKKRGRFDDVGVEITRRLDWYETDVLPAVDYYKTHPGYHFLDIHGERSVEDVHKDLIGKIDALKN
jgi:adenylate kinase